MGHNIVVLVTAAFAMIHFSMSELRQERAMMDWNPKYLSEGTAFTRRTGRGKSYSTNFTGTILNSWSSNVSLEITISTLTKQNLFQLRYNLCEFFKQKWANEFIRAYSDIQPKCPVPKGSHAFCNIVLPPKNFPIPLNTGDTRVQVAYIFNPTNETMINVSVILRLP